MTAAQTATTQTATTDTGATDTGATPASVTERAVPYCCPFCTEEDLRPLESGAVPGLSRGGWHCRSCLRVFSVSFHGLHQPVLPGSTPAVQPPLESEQS